MTKPTADVTANTVNPYFLKIALTLSFSAIVCSISSFSLTSLFIASLISAIDCLRFSSLFLLEVVASCSRDSLFFC